MPFQCPIRMRLLALLTSLLTGCGDPRVGDLAFPVVAIQVNGTVRGYLDTPALTTTNRQASDSLAGLQLIDAEGRRYTVASARAIDPPGMFSDFAGTRAFQVDLSLTRGPKLSQAEAVAAVAAAVRATPGHLDLTEQGGAAVADELAALTSLARVAQRLATRYEPRRVTAEALDRGNRRAAELARRGE